MQPRAMVPAFETTSDTLFAGALRLVQPARGHRAGTDAVLLAAACPPGARIVDLGCGAGTVGLRIAQQQPATSVTLIDRDPAILMLAAQNIAANGLAGRVHVQEADALSRSFALAGAAADVIVTNPPFDQPGTVRVSPEKLRAVAHVLDGGLDDWIKTATKCLTPGGALVMIHRADALARCLAAVEGRFGAITILPVHPQAGATASRLLIKGQRGSKAPLRMMPPLILHGADGAFTPEAAAIHAGTAAIRLDQQTR